MTDHVMKLTEVPGALANSAGYRPYFTEQVTDAAVADDDTLTFKNCNRVIPIGILSEIGSIIDFDASAASSEDWQLTVNTTVITTGTAATSVKGLIMAKK